ncbi:MAG: arsenite methyltransferase [Bradymonadia bacterium]|jgi:arsenite methyltransferase
MNMMSANKLDAPPSVDATFWNKIAEKYSHRPVELPKAFERKIAITKDCMSADDIVLDIGCGTGSLALRLAETGAHVHGLDVSTEMVRIARAKPAPEHGSVSFHVGPFDDSLETVADGSLDGVCAYSLLHLVDDADAALRQIYRLLKPGGFFVSSTPCLGDSMVPYGAIIGVMRLLGKAPMVKTMSRAALTEAIAEAGFVNVSSPDVGAKPATAFFVACKPE